MGGTKKCGICYNNIIRELSADELLLMMVKPKKLFLLSAADEMETKQEFHGNVHQQLN